MKRFLCSAVFFSFFFFCDRNSTKDSVREIRFMMDTVVTITIYESSLDKQKVHQAINSAFMAIEAVENRFSVHIDSSEISRLNHSAGEDPVPVSREMAALLATALDVNETTGGAFDITSGVLKALWGFDSDSSHVPDSLDILKRLSLVDSRYIHLHEGTVTRSRSGIIMDLGGIAKGQAIDEAVRVLKAAGIRAGLVDAGGDLRIFGAHPTKKFWTIGIRHPRSTAPSLIGRINIPPASVATSGDYERFFMEDQVRYHHLLDPKTGYPARQCVSVTIITDQAILADAFATGVFIMGPEKGAEWIESHPDIEGLLLFEKNGRLQKWYSSGLAQSVQFIE